jgi:hypothetical protein
LDDTLLVDNKVGYCFKNRTVKWTQYTSRNRAVQQYKGVPEKMVVQWSGVHTVEFSIIRVEYSKPADKFPYHLVVEAGPSVQAEGLDGTLRGLTGGRCCKVRRYRDCLTSKRCCKVCKERDCLKCGAATKHAVKTVSRGSFIVK